MNEFKNISIDMLKTFEGTVCLYSLKKTENLGINIKDYFENLFNNKFTYLDSLGKESSEDIVLIDGDDFNAAKIFGLTKKYTVPIIIFISNVDKLNKLKELLLRDILIIDKNLIIPINIENKIKENIKNKELKDAQKLLEQENKTEIYESIKTDEVEELYIPDFLVKDISEKMIKKDDVIVHEVIQENDVIIQEIVKDVTQEKDVIVKEVMNENDIIIPEAILNETFVIETPNIKDENKTDAIVNIPENKNLSQTKCDNDIEYKNISINELKTFIGSICLYSVKEEESLGININNTFKDILQSENILYKSSLAIESSEDLILIDGDSFNAVKIFGLTKKYTVPIVIFISNVDKLNKLKELLLRDVLIIDKNLIIPINIESEIKYNIKAKELKDAQKLLEQEILENPEINTKKTPLDNVKIDSEVKEISFLEEFKDKFKFDRVYHNTNSVFIMESIKNIFQKDFTFLPLFSNKNIEFDFLILDLNYCSLSRLYEWFEVLKPCPMIIIGYRKNNLENISKFLNRNILRIEKPFDLTETELKDIIRDYLNGYKKEEEIDKPLDRDYDPKIGIPKDTYDNKEQEEIRINFNINGFRNDLKNDTNQTKEEKIKNTKDIINSSNKRTDKSFSLKELYKRFDLDSLSIFDSKLNKGIYTTIEGKVITYTPEGYFIEHRIQKLKNKGLSSKELSSALERLEEADIRFQQNKLKKMDIKKRENERNIKTENKTVGTKSSGNPSERLIVATTEDRKELFIEKYSDRKKSKENKTSKEGKDILNLDKYDKQKVKARDIINDTIKNIKDKVDNIDFNIFLEFSEFILNYRLLRKEYKIKKKQEKENLQLKIIEKQRKQNEDLKSLDSNENIQNNRRYNLLSDIQTSDKEKMKHLRRLASTENSNNKDELNVKHNKSKVLLSELNNKLNEKALYDRVIINKVEKIDNSNEEKLESTFRDVKFRPPKK